jgi:hypothetical protein
VRFDWYQATIQDDPRRVIGTLGKLGHEVRSNDRVGKMYRYTQGFEVHHRERGVVARIACDGADMSTAHAWATSDEAQEFADLVREEWPDRHLVTRVDSCQDFIDGKAFQRLRKVGRKVAKQHRVSFPSISDELNPTAGRTQYMGSPSSEYRVRIYEKGWEVIGKAIGALHMRRLNVQASDIDSIRVPGLGRECYPGDWVRAEAQARPKEEAGRRAAAVASPEEMWAFSPWTHEMARDALALDLERFYFRTRKTSTDEKALRWMCRQYGNMLVRLHGDLGDWPCVGLEIGATLAKIEAEDQELRAGHYTRPAP